MDMYTSTIIIEIFDALVLGVFIAKNPMIGTQMKKCFTRGFLVLAIVGLSEWLTIRMNGSSESLRGLHYVVKYFEFFFVPVIPAIFIDAFIKVKKRKELITVLIVHGVFELIAMPFGLIFYMDEANCYVRGPFYPVYVLFYVLMSVFMVIEIARFGKGYQNNNYVLIGLGCVFLVSGISLQLFNSEIRTSWLCVELTLILAYIYVNDLILQTDTLTGLLNRLCYEKQLMSVKYDSVVVFFDVDSFKSINDTFGHSVGDEALKLVSRCILNNFGKEARCYRIGGDEFCAVFKKKSKYSINQSHERISALIEHFEMEIREIRKDDPRFTGVSVGYSFVNKEFEINWAVEYADRKMYECKKRNKDAD